jgi:outer membrane receptor protein involved in Fe transport
MKKTLFSSSAAMGLLAALAAPGGAHAETAPAPAATTDQGSSVQEVIVTAEKKEQRLKDVPAPVSVLDADNLAQTNQTHLSDYFDVIPGLYATPDQFNRSILSIRGVSPVGEVPTVGILIDEVPFGLSSSQQTGFVPNIDPGDLERIEVLRGPQGTLYGADAMGGLVKYVTRDPTTSGFFGRFEAGASEVSHGSDPGHVFRASANIPLSSNFAIRLSGYTQQDPGYINNPVLHQNGINQTQSYGGRLAALWKPSDDMSLKFTALYQDAKSHGISEADVPTPGYPGTTNLKPLEQNYLAGTGADGLAIQDYSLVFKDKIGRFQVTSITGYNVTTVPWSVDLGFLITPALVSATFPGTAGVPYDELDKETKLSQELRVSTSFGKWLDVLVGGFYTYENSNGRFTVIANDANQQQLGVYWTFLQPKAVLKETAAFADLTFHVTSRFSVEVGARESSFTTILGHNVQEGPYAALYLGGSPSIAPELKGSKQPFTYLLTPQYKITPDVMVYARFASGYRPAQPNTALPNVPRESNPDQTKDNEVGLKGDFLGRRLQIDLSIYYIDWQNIQLALRDPATHFVYNGNAGAAKSQGLEFSAQARPRTGLTLGATFSYDDAEITKSFQSVSAIGSAGDSLPFTSRFSGSVSAEQTFRVGPATGFAGVVAAYIGDRKGQFIATPARQDYPAYAKVDLHAGFRLNGWTVTAYGNNVSDERGMLNGGAGYFFPQARTYITPRTVGIDVTRSF